MNKGLSRSNFEKIASPEAVEAFDRAHAGVPKAPVRGSYFWSGFPISMNTDFPHTRRITASTTQGNRNQ